MIPILGWLGALFLGLARRSPPARERRFLGIGLLVAALIYPGLVLLKGAAPRWLLLGDLGVLLYEALAWGGMGYTRACWPWEGSSTSYGMLRSVCRGCPLDIITPRASTPLRRLDLLGVGYILRTPGS